MKTANAKNPRFLVLMKEAGTCWVGGFWCVDVSCFALLLGWAKIGWIGFHRKRISLITFESSELPALSCPCAGKTESEDDKEVESTSGEFITTTAPQFYFVLSDDDRMKI